MTQAESYSSMVVGLGQIGMEYDLSLSDDKYVYTHASAFSTHTNIELSCGVDPISPYQ